MAIERKFIAQNIKEFRIKEYISKQVLRVGLANVKLKKTPLGDKVVISASRPGLIVGRGGANIQALTANLKREFKLENPQIEIEEVAKPDLDANIVAERIINSLERFGSGRTKGIGHRSMSDVMNAGALGVEILISGKIPSMRARRWRFYNGYLKKAGDIAVEGVDHSIKYATLKSGSVGVQVRIMPPTIVLPDHITLTDSPAEEIEVTEVASDAPETPEVVETPTTEESTEKPAEKEVAQPQPETEQPTETETVSVSEDKEASDTEDKS